MLVSYDNYEESFLIQIVGLEDDLRENSHYCSISPKILRQVWK